ncbi:MAG: TIGR03915 family putative DNA repair protein [Burkholderiaceae bacterium]
MITWHVRLEGADDWTGFRTAARHLLAHDVPAQGIAWSWQVRQHGPAGPCADQTLLAPETRPGLAPVDVAERLPVDKSSARAFRVPARALEICRGASLHRDEQRFALVYRWLQRLRAGAIAADDALDPDHRRLARMARAVSRDMHKMRAFVRFRPLARPDGLADLHVATFEPEHHVARANADFFVRRFTNMHWMIVTPEVGLRWDGDTRTLTELPGSGTHELPAADAGEALWLTYYRSTFNGARLKPAAMVREMPRRYWKHLPEARLISGLIQESTRAASTGDGGQPTG